MWAPKGWEYGCGAGLVNTPPTSNVDLYVTPVLVTSAEGMPDFKEGDKVRARLSGKQGCVRAVAMVDGGWCVYWRDTGGVCHEYDPAFLTKLPRAVTKLVRVTGPEDGVERVLYSFTDRIVRPVYPEGVRVEIVEEER